MWKTEPTYLYLGEVITIDVYLVSSLAQLYMKGVTYTLIMSQLAIISSKGFKRFKSEFMVLKESNENLIGRGIAYRFNNFKNKRVLKQAKEFDYLERMLAHVKKLIKRRDRLYEVAKKAKKQKMTIVEEEMTDQEIPEFQKDLRQQFKEEIKIEYETRLKKLGLVERVYLYIRRNFVQDILFKHSQMHLEDMVQQFYNGRTSVKTQLELGLMIQTKKDWLEAKKHHLQALFREGQDVSDHTVELANLEREVLKDAEIKPWERVNLKKYRSLPVLLKNYCVLLYKVLASYSEVFCYIFMISALMSNGGFIYLPYPFMVFAVAIVQEEKPRANYWYFVLIYTQILILVQFMV